MKTDLPEEMVNVLQDDAKPPEDLVFRLIGALEKDNLAKVRRAQRKVAWMARYRTIRNYASCAGIAAALTFTACWYSLRGPDSNQTVLLELAKLDQKIARLEMRGVGYASGSSGTELSTRAPLHVALLGEAAEFRSKMKTQMVTFEPRIDASLTTPSPFRTKLAANSFSDLTVGFNQDRVVGAP